MSELFEIDNVFQPTVETEDRRIAADVTSTR
jgi:hypothetical protein